MHKKKSSRREIQKHVDRWADLMHRIIKNPRIADRIPNHANVMFGEGDVIFINGEPQRYSELVKSRKRKASTRRKQPA
jgi:hypothetical protein